MHGEEKDAYNILVGKSERKKSLGRPSRRWEGNIRMGVGEIGWRLWTGFIWFRITTDGGLL
jgi:hypothetical protein